MWSLCFCCENYWCHIHGKHAHDCSCPPVECWPESPYVPSKDTFAIRLTRLRIAAGLSQRQLAKASHISQQAISLLERGQRDPTLGTLRALAKVLGVDVTELVRDLR